MVVCFGRGMPGPIGALLRNGGVGGGSFCVSAQRPWLLARRSLKQTEEPEYDPPQAEEKPRQQQWHDHEEDQGSPWMHHSNHLPKRELYMFVSIL
jgi:hypothetical protein